MPAAELDRKLRLLEAAWTFFDEVAGRVSAEMRKGARGGGRDRDEIISHVLRNEQGDFAKKVGVPEPPVLLESQSERSQHREDFAAGIRDYNDRGLKAGRSWTVPFLLRHTAFHALDHAWEMEDKDLS